MPRVKSLRSAAGLRREPLNDLIMTPWLRRVATGLIVAAAAHAQPSSDPFVFFQPSLVVTGADRQRLDDGETLVRVLPAKGHEIAIAAAVRVTATGERLVAWVRDIADLKRSPYVMAIGRFSDPPRLDDLASLALDDADLNRLQRCGPGACDVKLTASEIAQLQRAMTDAREDWRPAAQAAFRGIVLSRVQAYLADGPRGLAALNDTDAPLASDADFAQLVRGWPFLARRVPALVEHLQEHPGRGAPQFESFLYWSKERLGGRPIISVTHVVIARPHGNDLPDALIAGRQLFATHYITGSVSLTALVRNGPDSPAYLVYLNRSNVDVLQGLFGRFIRIILERRLKSEASGVLQGLRQRLESGNPPGSATLLAPGALEQRAGRPVGVPDADPVLRGERPAEPFGLAP